MPDEVRGSFGRTFFISAHCRERWAERFPFALSTLEHAVRFGRVTRENNYGLVLHYDLEQAAFVCNRTAAGYVVVTVVNTFGNGDVTGRFALEKRKNKNQRAKEKAMKGAPSGRP